MNKEKILEYVTKTPENTNRNVLGSMLDQFAKDSGGGDKTAEKTVNFYDYDGEVLHSYTADEFLALKQMPENPTHDGLTSQGWNWSLEDAQAYVQEYRMLNIGQTYITSDGKTRIHIKLYAGRLSPYLGINLNGTAEVDWGDGSAIDTMVGTSLDDLTTLKHIYASEGEYVITLNIIDGMFEIRGLSSKTRLLNNEDSATTSIYDFKCIDKVFVGDFINCISPNAFNYCSGLTNITIPKGITSIGQNAFSNCYKLTSITIPEGVTNIGQAAFNYCSGLTSVIIPDGITSIGQSAFDSCSGLTSITIPGSVTNIGQNAFSNCYNLTSITIPEGVTSIGQSAFNFCSGLTSITIPGSVTNIGQNAFDSCRSLTSITIPGSVTSINAQAFGNCRGLTSVIISDGVTNIGQAAFNYCSGLTSITIPQSVTSIGVSAFSGCRSLTSITIPESVTSINAQAFSNCYSMGEYHILSTTPPNIYTNTFSVIPGDCKIFVPAQSVDTYKSATNWSTYASKIVGE